MGAGGMQLPPPPAPGGLQPQRPQQLPLPPPGPPMGGGMGDGPDAKRARTEFILEAEEDFIAKFTGSSKVRVQCPEVEGSDKLIGQLLEVEVATLRDTVGHFKSRLADVLDLPANKQKLNREGVGFLRDELTLAHYNVGPDVVLTLGTKARGGRK